MKTFCTIISMLLLVVTMTSADTLNIPRIKSPPNTAEGVLRPVRGMTMETVLARFGEPKQRLPAVGNPPITRWIYERFTVYFEDNITLHSVVIQE